MKFARQKTKILDFNRYLCGETKKAGQRCLSGLNWFRFDSLDQNRRVYGAGLPNSW